MTKQFWAVIIAIVIIFGGVLAFHGNKNGAGGGTPTNHVEGGGSTGVTLVEYGDYECPYCGEYFPTVKQVVSEYFSQIHFQFRNLPLTQIHQNAFAGARAAEAAALQNQFWQMHDLLYENQNAWVNSNNVVPIFDSYATQLGLNLTKFKADYAGTTVDNSINADISAFDKTGQEEATPTFFLDGQKISPANTVASFQTLINAAIAKKTSGSITTTTNTSSSSSSNATMQQSKQ